jgi:hypothetical protein
LSYIVQGITKQIWCVDRVKPDLLYNDAGTGGMFVDIDFDDMTWVVNISSVTVLIGIHLAFPTLKATEKLMEFSGKASSSFC